MARAPRDFTVGGLYHVFSRGSNRQAIFAFDSDRDDFLMCLERAAHRHELRCLAYCLMPNHYHLLVDAPQNSLSAAMKALNHRYALRFNLRYGRDAHLFKNRFRAVAQETEEQFLWTMRYIIRNPIDSGLCARPEEWVWSSYRACSGLAEPSKLLDVGATLSYFGEEPILAMSRYREAMN
jgi:REP element-mobilizing transposase RayT